MGTPRYTYIHTIQGFEYKFKMYFLKLNILPQQPHKLRDAFIGKAKESLGMKIVSNSNSCA